jgi:hypothetical protein
MNGARIASALFFLLLCLAVLLMLSGCTWQTKPVVFLYEPQLAPISRTDLQCLDDRTYQALVRRDLEWRAAFGECKAVVDELSEAP